MSNHPARRSQYEPEHSRSTRRKGDRINNRPTSLRELLRWAQSQYALEPPPRLHDRDVADDGAPDHTGEAKSYIGLSQDKEPNDWRAVACRTDADGYHITPLRCAIERVPGEERRTLLRALLPNVFFPRDAAEAAGILVQLIAPMMPHLAEECWAVLGRSGLVAQAPWPEAEAGLLVEDEITLPVQINGKKRADVTVPRDADAKAVEAATLALEAVQKVLEGKAPRKVIVVPGRIVNLVA